MSGWKIPAAAIGVVVLVGAVRWTQLRGDEMADSDSPDTCGAAAHADKVGTPRADHDFADGDRPLRIIPPNSAVTMDHRPERLNVDVDADGIITRIWCG